MISSIALMFTCVLCFFFFNDTATTEIYTLSLHDALPICGNLVAQGHRDRPGARPGPVGAALRPACGAHQAGPRDRKSTRLNSSHANISYAVFCLKKKKTTYTKSSLNDCSHTLLSKLHHRH